MRLEDDILDNLGRLPNSLTTAYSQTFKTVREELTVREWDLTTKALMWIMCALVPPTQDVWTEMSYWPTPVPMAGSQILFDLCRNLVAWDPQSKRVKFAHLSVNEYLDTMFSSIQTNTMAAARCLSLFEPTASPLTVDFQYYSTNIWPDHVEKCYSPDQAIDETLLNQLRRFFRPPGTPGHGYLDWCKKVLGSSGARRPLELD